jgi:RNase adaptor protein for sRNA GlmZ degradation
MAPKSPKISLNTRLSDAIDAIGSQAAHEDIRPLFTEVCDDMLCNYSNEDKLPELKQNLVLMNRIAIGAKSTKPVKAYTQAFIDIAGTTAKELHAHNETVLSFFMSNLVHGANIFDQPFHFTELDRNPTPRKSVNKDTNQMNY